MLDEKDLQAIDQLMAHRMNIILESEISPKLNLLTEGMEILQEKMAPRSRVDELDLSLIHISEPTRRIPISRMPSSA